MKRSPRLNKVMLNRASKTLAPINGSAGKLHQRGMVLTRGNDFLDDRKDRKDPCSLNSGSCLALSWLVTMTFYLTHVCVCGQQVASLELQNLTRSKTRLITDIAKHIRWIRHREQLQLQVVPRSVSVVFPVTWAGLRTELGPVSSMHEAHSFRVSRSKRMRPADSVLPEIA